VGEYPEAALEWTEPLTKITEGHVPDAIYALVRRGRKDLKKFPERIPLSPGSTCSRTTPSGLCFT